MRRPGLAAPGESIPAPQGTAAARTVGATAATLEVRASDGVRLAAYVSGPADAPPLILIHGYPDSACVWEPVRRQLESRYRVIAYDVRGAGASGAPPKREGYRLAQLVSDLLAVADLTCGTRPFHLIGHDWGALQGWECVTEPSLAPRLASYTSIAGACLDHTFLARFNPRQTLKSWYIAFFHLPLLPELVWRIGGAPLWRHWLRRTEYLTPADDPHQVRNGLNGLELYRANFLERARHPRQRRTAVPVQIIVPVHDRYLTPELTLNLERWLSGPLVRKEIDASHWTIVRDAALIATRIDRFVQAHATTITDATAPPSETSG